MEAQYGINVATWNKIIAAITSQKGIEKVVLFGSRAKGTHKNGSDIDLCLYGEISLQQVYRIQDLLDDLMLPYKFDLLIYNTINNSELIEHINRVGCVLYS